MEVLLYKYNSVASYKIGQYFNGKGAEGSTAHILAHTILGAAVAVTGGNNALTAGIAAGGAEAAAPLLSQYLYGKEAKDLTASEKSTISSIVGLAGSAVGAITGDVSSTVQSGQSAQNAVENNYQTKATLRVVNKQLQKCSPSDRGCIERGISALRKADKILDNHFKTCAQTNDASCVKNHLEQILASDASPEMKETIQLLKRLGISTEAMGLLNETSGYSQKETQLVKAILCWNAKCQQEYKDMDARQEAAYRKGQNQAISKFAEDIKNLPNVPQELYDALRNDPQGTTIAILNGIFAIPGEIINTGVTITKGNLVGSSTSDFEKLGQAEMSATLNTLSGFLSAGAVTVAKKGGKIVLGLKADFDPNLNVQVNGITSKSTGNIVELKAGSKGDWNKLANKPEANTTYKFENGYTYKTDANGRVSSVQADLKLEANDRNGYQQKVSGRTDRKPDDHGGHLIASMFKGPGEGINIVPMDKAFNGSGGEWYKLETDWKKALEGNKSVKVNIQPVYSGNSKRPDSFIITQSVDSGKPRTLTLKNTATGK